MIVEVEKTAPVILLENRRKHLVQWLADGEKKITAAEHSIKETKHAAVEMTAEIDAIEKALNILHASQESG